VKTGFGFHCVRLEGLALRCREQLLPDVS